MTPARFLGGDWEPSAEAVLAVVAVKGAAISTLGGILDVETLAATDAQIARIDELQFDLREGPCWDAVASGSPVLEPDLRRAPRRTWGAFSPAVEDEAVAALFAFPLAVGPFRLGAIDLYTPDPRELAAAEIEAAAEVAREISRLVLRRAIRLAAPDAQVSDAGSHSRRAIHHATGFLIAQLGVSAEDAELLLQGQAFAEGRSMRAVADDVVARRRRYRMDGDMIEDVR